MSQAQDFLKHIKSKGKTSSKAIAKKIDYNESYFSRGLKEEGETDIFLRLKAAYPKEFKEWSDLSPSKKMEQEDRAVLLALLDDHLKLKAQVTGRSVEDLAAELEQNTTLLRRRL